MPFLSQAVLHRVRDPYFWSDYLFDEDGLLLPADTSPRMEAEEEMDSERYPEFSDPVLSFATQDGLTLTLTLNPDCSYTSLELKQPPHTEPTEIAWVDMAHWHPDVLRWEELELICRCLALADPECAHPGVPLLLLNRFAPLCAGDDAEMAFALLESAWRSLGLAPAPYLQWFRDARDVRTLDWTWQADPERGWHITAPEDSWLYTLRDIHHNAFPWAAWNEFIAGLRRNYREAIQPDWLTYDNAIVPRLLEKLEHTGSFENRDAIGKALHEAGCANPTILAAFRPDAAPAMTGWVAELLLDRKFGTILRRLVTPATEVGPDVNYELLIEIPVHDGSFPTRVDTPTDTVSFSQYLSLCLQETGTGFCTGRGARANAEGKFTAESISLTIRNDLEVGLTVVRQALRKAEVSNETRLILIGKPSQELPF